MHVSLLLPSYKEGILITEDFLKLASYVMKMLFFHCSISIFIYTNFSFLSVSLLPSVYSDYAF